MKRKEEEKNYQQLKQETVFDNFKRKISENALNKLKLREEKKKFSGSRKRKKHH